MQQHPENKTNRFSDWKAILVTGTIASKPATQKKYCHIMYTFHSSCNHPAHNHIPKKKELIMNMSMCSRTSLSVIPLKATSTNNTLQYFKAH
jgi:hypothetical protein